MTPTEMHIDALMDKDSYKKGFQDGHKCCAYEKEKLKAENARYREALEKIQSLTFSWVMNKDNAEDILLVVAPIREKCRESLKDK